MVAAVCYQTWGWPFQSRVEQITVDQAHGALPPVSF